MIFNSINIVPYARLLRRLFIGPGAIENIAFQKDIIWPLETLTARPAVCLPGQIEKIRDRVPESRTTNETEIAQATSPTLTHGATIAHHIKDAILLDGRIYTKNVKC